MGRLKKAFRVLSDIGYIGKFDSPNVSIGDVYFWDDQRWNYIENIKDDIPFDQYIRKSDPVDLKFIKDSAIDVKIGAQGAVGVAKGKISLDFSKKKSAFVYLKDSVSVELGVGEIIHDLAALWDKKGYHRKKHALCTQLIQAPSGTVIFSMEKNNSIELGAKGNSAGLKKLEDVASGNVQIDKSKSDYFELISDKPFEPLFRAVNIQGTKRKPKFDWVK